MRCLQLQRVILGVFLGYISAGAGLSKVLYAAEVRARLVSSIPATPARAALIWLEPVGGVQAHTTKPGKFTLLQKNKQFIPHVLVVPVGSSIAFPNADPFFHNVFSLFDGKRFDLGLYEAGSTRSVVFSRPGISYIFCNIHSGMSAVVIALDTPFYSIANQEGTFHMSGVSSGDYDLHVWAEGEPQSSLDKQTRRVRITGVDVNLGDIHVSRSKMGHLNKFGRPYDPDSAPTY